MQNESLQCCKIMAKNGAIVCEIMAKNSQNSAFEFDA